MNIRAIGITPNYTNTNCSRTAVNFGKKEYDDTERKYTELDKHFQEQCSDVTGIFKGMLAMGLICFGSEIIDDAKFQKNLEKLEKTIESNEIQKDTFMFKDVTGDEKPDMVLFKKDGTKVVYDIAENKILEETANKPILKEVK